MKKNLFFIIILLAFLSTIGYSYTIKLPSTYKFPVAKGIKCECFPKFIDDGSCYLYYDYSPSLVSIPFAKEGKLIRCERK